MSLERENLVAELKQNYAVNTAPRMGMGSAPAMLVVDFVEGFTNSKSPLAGQWDEQVNNTVRLLEAFRKKKLPLAFTTVEYVDTDLETNLLGVKAPRIKLLSKGSKWTEIDHRLSVNKADIVISKKYGSAFFATDLASRLQAMSVDTLLISGCVTSGCVRASAVDAAQSGFRPIVVRETVGDRSVLAHEANLMDIEQRYGDVVSLDEALNYIADC